jgi:hypothetical protein
MFHLQHWCTELVDIEIHDVGTWLPRSSLNNKTNLFEILEVAMKELTAIE